MSRLAAVTGSTGFLGRHVLRALVADGWRLRLLVRSDPRLTLAIPDDCPVELVLGDLTDPANLTDPGTLRQLVTGADAIIHIGGAIKAPNRASFMRINRDGTEALAKAWQADAPLARFVFLSSLAARKPNLSHYATSKSAAETVLESLAPGAVHTLRPTAIYGPGDRETLALFKAVQQPVHPLLGGADARLSLVHVHDVARAVLAAATTAVPGCFEVTDGQTEGYSWQEIVGNACRAVGTQRKAFRVPAAVLRTIGRIGDVGTAVSGSANMVTSQKVREILHPDWSSHRTAQLPANVWHPTIELQAGFDLSAAWYKKAGWLRN